MQNKYYWSVLQSLFPTKPVKPDAYFTLTAHLSLNESHAKGSVTIFGQRLLCWTVQIQDHNPPGTLHQPSYKSPCFCSHSPESVIHTIALKM